MRFHNTNNQGEYFMRIKTLVGASLLAAAPMLAHAERNSLLNYVDLLYVPTADLEVLGTKIDGDGFGLRVSGEVASGVFLSGEYQTVGYDFDVDFDQLRAGVGYAHPLSQNLLVTAAVEYIRVEVDLAGMSESDTGYGLHLGVLAPLSEQFSLVGRVGHVDIGDVDGLELLAGIRFKVSDAIGLSLEYRQTDLDDFEIKDLRIGVGYHF